MELFGAGHAASGRAVEGRRLVGVLAIAQAHALGRAQAEQRRQGAGGALALQAGADGGVVIGGGAEGFLRQAPVGPGGKRAAVRFHLLDDGGVVLGGYHHGDVLVILGGGADHGGAADIDIFDEFFERRAGLFGHLFEAIEVDHHHINGCDLVFRQGLHVIGALADGQNSAGDFRVEGFDPPVEHLGEARDLGNILHGHARVADGARGPAGGNKLGAEGVQLAGEIDEAGFIGDAYEYALDLVHLKKR